MLKLSDWKDSALVSLSVISVVSAFVFWLYPPSSQIGLNVVLPFFFIGMWALLCLIILVAKMQLQMSEDTSFKWPEAVDIRKSTIAHYQFVAYFKENGLFSQDCFVSVYWRDG